MFNLNEKVQWSSQAGGITTLKVGTIVAVIQPGEPLDLTTIGKGRIEFDHSGPRRVVNYLVKVGRKLYRPLTSKLAKHEEIPEGPQAA